MTSARGLVLVTGASGYLGGRIAQHLLAGGWRVRLASRNPAALGPLPPSAEPRAFPDDFGHEALRMLCRGADVVIHAAALNEKSCAADPAHAVEVNTVGTVRLLRAAEAERVPRFVYLSTAYVYGTPLVGVVEENHIARPQDVYAISHRGAEDYVLAAHDQGRLLGAVLRLSSAVGAPMHAEVDRWSLMTNQLCREAVTTRQIRLRSSGMQWRDFMPISDLCAAVSCVLAQSRDALGDGVLNVGAGASLRVIDFAELIARPCHETLGFSPGVLRPELPSTAVPESRFTFAIERLRALGFRPSGSLDAELDATLALCARAFGSDGEARER